MRFVLFISLALSIAADRGISQTTPPRYSITAAAGSAPPSGDNGPATAALLRSPQYIAVDGAGNIYFSEGLGYRIRKVAPDGTITTVAGTGAAEESSDGSQANASPIDDAEGVTLDGQGNLCFVDLAVRRILSAGTLMTTAGSTSNAGFAGDGGPATSAQINAQGIAFDLIGNLYIADTGNNRVRRVDTNGVITTIAGTGVAGFSGDGGAATAAQLNRPSDMRADTSGNLYIADRFNNRIRRISPSGIITTFAGTGTAGSAGDGGSAASAQLNSPAGLAIDSSGRIYVSEFGGNRVRRITQTLAVASIETVAGTGTGGFAGDGALAISAQIDQPWGTALDSAGNLYIADGGVSQRIRKVSTSGIISTVAGASHFTGDGGAAVSALLNFPEAVAADTSGNLYIADSRNHRIRQVTLDGKIRTIAGSGAQSFSGDGGPATSASLNGPMGVAVDRGGNVYIADTGNARIRMINPAGVITTVAGTGITTGTVGDGGPATSASLNSPRRIAIDSAGNLYVADAGTSRVRMVNTKGTISTVAGTGTQGFSGDGGLAASAELSTPSGVAVDTTGNLFIADSNNERVRKVDGNGIITTVAGNGGGVVFSGDGGPATSAGIRGIPSVAVDSSGNIFLADPLNGRLRMVNSAGIISTIAGSGTRVSTGDGGLAISATIAADTADGTLGFGFALGQGGVIYFADIVGQEIRKLTPNVPAQFTIASGNNQSGGPGASLPNPLVVSIVDPSGVAVPGVSVTFAVTSGSGKLSATSTVTASNGLAGVALTLGNVTGTTVVSASIAGSTLPPVQFTATASAACSVPQPVVTSVNSASDFGGSPTFAPGSWLEIKGSNLAQSTRQWAGGDFSGSNAPTSLDGVAVTIDGNQAFVAYISPSQINVQAPADAATGGVQLTVTTASCLSAGFTVQEAAIAPGLLAPSSFNIAGKQYLVATFPDGVTYVGNTNLIAGVPFRPAAPGDVITAYGIGFGAVSPPIPPGIIAGVANSLPNLNIGFGTTPATVLYAGLAPGTVGEYQFTFSVPNVANGDYPIVFQLGSTQAPQTVYLTVHQ